MGGVAGAYFKVMTDTMIITLVCSFLVTWIGLPVIYILFSFEKHSVKEKSHSVKSLKFVSFFINKPYIAGGFVLLLIITAFVILPKLPSGFLPDMDEGAIVLDYKSPAGSSLEATNKMLKVVCVSMYIISKPFLIVLLPLTSIS